MTHTWAHDAIFFATLTSVIYAPVFYAGLMWVRERRRP